MSGRISTVAIIFSYLGFALFCLLVFRAIVRREYIRRGRLTFAGVVLELEVFGFRASMLYLHVPADWPNLPALEDRPLMNAFGILLIVVGLIGLLLAMKSPGFLAALGEGKDRLHREGMYRWSRNPQIVAYWLDLIGCALLWPSLLVLLWLAAYDVAAHLMIHTEEEFLVKAYGSDYSSYSDETPRYVGLVKWIGRILP